MYPHEISLMISISLMILVKQITAQNVAGLNPATCTPGESVIGDSIRYECYKDGKIKGVKPTACVNEIGLEMKPGETWEGVYFIYACSKPNSDSNELTYDIAACLTPLGTEFTVGTNVNEDGGIYECIRSKNSSVTRTFRASTFCTYNNTNVMLGDVIQTQNSSVKCIMINGKLEIFAKACLPNCDQNETACIENAIAIGGVYQQNEIVFKCIRNSRNNSLTELKATVNNCTGEGKEHKIGDEWIVNDYLYKCELKGLVANAVLKKCIHYPHSTEQLSIGLGSVQQSKYDGFFYWCKRTNESQYMAVALKVLETQCNDTVFGDTFVIGDKWGIENIRYMCRWSNGKAVTKEIGCTSPEGSNMGIDDVFEMSGLGEGYICERFDGHYFYRQLTIEEYAIWKMEYSSSISGSGQKAVGSETTIVEPEPETEIDVGCNDTMLDMVFVLDMSASATLENITMIKQFLSNLVKSDLYCDGSSHFSILLYNNTAQKIVIYRNLIGEESKASIESAIGAIDYSDNKTAANSAGNAIGQSLKTAKELIFMPGERTEAVQCVMVITDLVGEMKGTNPIEAALGLKQESINVYVVGVGSSAVDQALYLTEIAGQSNIFLVANFSMLNQVILIEDISGAIIEDLPDMKRDKDEFVKMTVVEEVEIFMFNGTYPTYTTSFPIPMPTFEIPYIPLCMGKYMEYQTCGSNCLPMCENPEAEMYCLAYFCQEGCFCKEGYLMNATGDCVSKQKCIKEESSRGKCPLGSRMPPTSVPLGSNCENSDFYYTEVPDQNGKPATGLCCPIDSAIDSGISITWKFAKTIKVIAYGDVLPKGSHAELKITDIKGSLPKVDKDTPRFVVISIQPRYELIDSASTSMSNHMQAACRPISTQSCILKIVPMHSDMILTEHELIAALKHSSKPFMVDFSDVALECDLLAKDVDADIHDVSLVATFDPLGISTDSCITTSQNLRISMKNVPKSTGEVPSDCSALPTINFLGFHGTFYQRDAGKMSKLIKHTVDEDRDEFKVLQTIEEDAAYMKLKMLYQYFEQMVEDDAIACRGEKSTNFVGDIGMSDQMNEEEILVHALSLVTDKMSTDDTDSFVRNMSEYGSLSEECRDHPAMIEVLKSMGCSFRKFLTAGVIAKERMRSKDSERKGKRMKKKFELENDLFRKEEMNWDQSPRRETDELIDRLMDEGDSVVEVCIQRKMQKAALKYEINTHSKIYMKSFEKSQSISEKRSINELAMIKGQEQIEEQATNQNEAQFAIEDLIDTDLMDGLSSWMDDIFDNFLGPDAMTDNVNEIGISSVDPPEFTETDDWFGDDMDDDSLWEDWFDFDTEWEDMFGDITYDDVTEEPMTEGTIDEELYDNIFDWTVVQAVKVNYQYNPAKLGELSDSEWKERVNAKLVEFENDEQWSQEELYMQLTYVYQDLKNNLSKSDQAFQFPRYWFAEDASQLSMQQFLKIIRQKLKNFDKMKKPEPDFNSRLTLEERVNLWIEVTDLEYTFPDNEMTEMTQIEWENIVGEEIREIIDNPSLEPDYFDLVWSPNENIWEGLTSSGIGLREWFPEDMSDFDAETFTTIFETKLSYFDPMKKPLLGPEHVPVFEKVRDWQIVEDLRYTFTDEDLKAMTPTNWRELINSGREDWNENVWDPKSFVGLRRYDASWDLLNDGYNSGLFDVIGSEMPSTYNWNDWEEIFSKVKEQLTDFNAFKIPSSREMDNDSLWEDWFDFDTEWEDMFGDITYDDVTEEPLSEGTIDQELYDNIFDWTVVQAVKVNYQYNPAKLGELTDFEWKERVNAKLVEFENDEQWSQEELYMQLTYVYQDLKNNLSKSDQAFQFPRYWFAEDASQLTMHQFLMIIRQKLQNFDKMKKSQPDFNGRLTLEEQVLLWIEITDLEYTLPDKEIKEMTQIEWENMVGEKIREVKDSPSFEPDFFDIMDKHPDDNIWEGLTSSGIGLREWFPDDMSDFDAETFETIFKTKLRYFDPMKKPLLGPEHVAVFEKVRDWQIVEELRYTFTDEDLKAMKSANWRELIISGRDDWNENVWDPESFIGRRRYDASWEWFICCSSGLFDIIGSEMPSTYNWNDWEEIFSKVKDQLTDFDAFKIPSSRENPGTWKIESAMPLFPDGSGMPMYAGIPEMSSGMKMPPRENGMPSPLRNGEKSSKMKPPITNDMPPSSGMRPPPKGGIPPTPIDGEMSSGMRPSPNEGSGMRPPPVDGEMSSGMRPPPRDGDMSSGMRPPPNGGSGMPPRHRDREMKSGIIPPPNSGSGMPEPPRDSEMSSGIRPSPNGSEIIPSAERQQMVNELTTNQRIAISKTLSDAGFDDTVVESLGSEINPDELNLIASTIAPAVYETLASGQGMDMLKSFVKNKPSMSDMKPIAESHPIIVKRAKRSPGGKRGGKGKNHHDKMANNLQKKVYIRNEGIGFETEATKYPPKHPKKPRMSLQGKSTCTNTKLQRMKELVAGANQNEKEMCEIDFPVFVWRQVEGNLMRGLYADGRIHGYKHIATCSCAKRPGSTCSNDRSKPRKRRGGKEKDGEKMRRMIEDILDEREGKYRFNGDKAIDWKTSGSGNGSPIVRKKVTPSKKGNSRSHVKVDVMAGNGNIWDNAINSIFGSLMQGDSNGQAINNQDTPIMVGNTGAGVRKSNKKGGFNFQVEVDVAKEKESGGESWWDWDWFGDSFMGDKTNAVQTSRKDSRAWAADVKKMTDKSAYGGGHSYSSFGHMHKRKK